MTGPKRQLVEAVLTGNAASVAAAAEALGDGAAQAPPHRGHDQGGSRSPDLRDGVGQEDAASAYLAVTFAVAQDHGIVGAERDEFVTDVLDTIA